MCCAGSERYLGLVLFLGLGACARLSMELPHGFLQLETPRSEFKATTPDDARLWVRQFTDRDQGDLSFWAETLKLDLIDNRGYVLDEETELLDTEDREGVQMKFSVTTEGERYGYLVAVFVIDGGSENTIRVAEFIAPRAVFAQYVEVVQNSILTIQP